MAERRFFGSSNEKGARVKFFTGPWSAHGFFQTVSKDLYCFGRNQGYQLGMGDNKTRYKLTPHSFIEKKLISKIAMGMEHSIFLTTDGKLLISGSRRGCIGIGTTDRSTILKVPTRFKAFENDETPKISILAESFFSNEFLSKYQEQELLFSDVFAGSFVSFVVLKDRQSVFACGLNASGQLGIGKAGEPVESIFKIVSLSEQISSISPGFFHTLFLNVRGEVFASGLFAPGIINSDGPHDEKGSKIPIKLSTDYKVKKIGTGRGFSILLTESNQVYVFGKIGSGEANTNIILKPELQCIPHDVLDFQNGVDHAIFLTKKGEVLSTGHGKGGQLGIPHYVVELNDQSRFSNVVKFDAREPKFLKNIVYVFCGVIHSYFVDKNFRIFGCGRCSWGALFNDRNEIFYTPKEIGSMFSKIIMKELIHFSDKGARLKFLEESCTELERIIFQCTIK